MISDAELEELRRRWNAAMEHPGRVQLLTPLPRKVRLELALQRAITDAGIWLGDHVSWRAADWWYRTMGRVA